MTAAGKGGLPPSGLEKGALPLKYLIFNPGCAYAGLASLPDTPAFCITLAQTKNGSRAGSSESRQIKKPAEAH